MKKKLFYSLMIAASLLGTSEFVSHVVSAQDVQPYVSKNPQSPQEYEYGLELANEGKISYDDADQVKVIGLEEKQLTKEEANKEKMAHNQDRDAKGVWMKTDGKWWFKYNDGHYSTAWDQIDGKWYYFDKEGWMQDSQWIQPDGNWYYLTESGAMVTGYYRVSGKPYFFRNSGVCVENTGQAMAEYAETFVGYLPYVWGGASLESGADCSGFVQAIHKQFDISIPRVTTDQAVNGTWISSGSQSAGDLILYSYSSANDHVGMYVGNGKVVHAPIPGRKVEYMNQNGMTQSVIRRYW